MPSFRSSKSQATYIVEQKLALGIPRHGNQQDGLIHSNGTMIRYEQAIKNLNDWLVYNNITNGLKLITHNHIMVYLEERSEQIRQKSLNIERRAIEICFDLKIPPISSLVANKSSHRSYTSLQLKLIIQRMKSHNALATLIAIFSGIRAHELHTLREPGDRVPSTHRKWSPDRFHGLYNYVLYTVIGKGGLIREVAIPLFLHLILNSIKRPETIVIDRKIQYKSCYPIGGGLALSKSFSTLSKKELGWSDGFHALRHNYARLRMATLQQLGFSYLVARQVVAEECGHFRGDITEVYLK